MCKLCAKCGNIIPPATAAKSRRIPDSQISPPPQHGALAPSLRPRPVIARNEAIHRRSHNSRDCHGAARLAMTELAERLAMTNLPAGNHHQSVITAPATSLPPATSLRGTKQSIGHGTTAEIATSLRSSMGWTLPPLTGIDVPKWKFVHHLNEKERPT
jgi:hypothetical protein